MSRHALITGAGTGIGNGMYGIGGGGERRTGATSRKPLSGMRSSESMLYA